MRYGVIVGFFALGLVGCSALPKYIEPKPGSGTAIVNGYSNLLLCKVNGPEGPGEHHACRAFISEVDGHYAGVNSSLRLAPGVREVRLFCFTRAFGDEGVDGGHSQLARISVTSGQVLNANPYWEGAICRVRLTDESGKEIPVEFLPPPAPASA